MFSRKTTGPVLVTTENSARTGAAVPSPLLATILALLPGFSQFFRKKFLLGILFLVPFIFLVCSLYFLFYENPIKVLIDYESFVSFQLIVFSILAFSAASILETLHYLNKNSNPQYSKTFYGFTVFNIFLVFSLIFSFAWVSFPQSFLLKNSFSAQQDYESISGDFSSNEFTGFKYSQSSSTEQGTSTDEATTDAAKLTEPTESAIAIPDIVFDENRVNILLIGGDAGPGRYGLRADSLNVVSIDTLERKATIIGIPRNLGNAPFPEGPLRDKMPNGFNNIVNALYGWGNSNKNLVNKTLGKSKDPGAAVLAASISEFTGLNITGWVLVDMGGFIEIVDALGGVDVYVPKDTKAAGAVADSKHKVKRFFEEGWNKLNGTRALSYTRTRSQDSDYSRMQRQRCVLASIAAQNKPLDLLVAWPAISNVLQNNMKTSLTSEEIQSFIVLAGLPAKDIKMLSLTPPLVPGFGWDASEVRAIVADSINNVPKNEKSSNKSSSIKQSCKTIKK